MNRNIILCVLGCLFINLSFVFAGAGKIEVSSITAQGDLYVGTNLNLNDNNISDVTGIVASTVIVNGNVHVSTLTTTYNLSAETLEVSGAAEADSLTVTGNIKFDGDLYVMAGAYPWRVVAGSIDSDGSRNRGSGFDNPPVHLGTGKYGVIFSDEFSFTPMAVVTPNTSSDNFFTVASISTSSMTVHSYDDHTFLNAGLEDCGFDFVVIGGR